MRFVDSLYAFASRSLVFTSLTVHRYDVGWLIDRQLIVTCLVRGLISNFQRLHQDLVLAPFGPRWRTRRKLCALQLFSPKALDDLCPVREVDVSILARTLHAHAQNHTPVNLGQALMACTTNALSKAMLGHRVFTEDEEEEESKEASEFKELAMDIMKTGLYNVSDFVPN